MKAPHRPTDEVPFIDMGAIHAPVEADLVAAFGRVLAHADFVVGAEVAGFEAELAEAVATPHAVGVNSGTAALALALEGAGIGAGDEVLFPPNSFFATAGAIREVGARPVPVDVDPRTGLIDLDGAASRVTDRTAGVVVVHLYGNPVDMGAARAFADRHGLFLLEDAAQAIGATWDGRPIGSWGDAAAFSFYPTKNLGAVGQGGAVTTADAELARKVRLLREHGEAERHHHVVWGHNQRLDGIQAAALRVKLARLDEAQVLRDAAAAAYRDALAGVEGVELFDIDPRAHHVHHLMVVKVDRRDAVRAHLAEVGVATGIHYPVPIHRQPAFEATEGVHHLPASEDHARRVVSLPMYPGLAPEQVERVVTALQGAVAAGPSGS